MEIIILAAMGVLILLVAVLLVRGRHRDVTGVQAALRQEFLAFQTAIHTQMDAARQGVEGAKDVISGHALRTMEQMAGIGKTVEKLIQQQDEAQRLGQSLKDLLQAPKLRGNYGEVILEEMLDKVLSQDNWGRQYPIEGGERVDCAVLLRDVVVPIDAKFPRDDYLRYIDAESDDQRAVHWKAFEQAVKQQVTSIQTKYIRPEHGTTEFALMFIPSDAIYYETIAERNHLGEPSTIWQFAQDHQVVPVGPNTFYAFLQVVILSIRNVDIVHNARQLQGQLASLERGFGLFYKKYEDIGSKLRSASESYRVGEDHISRYKDKLDGALRMRGLTKEESPVLAARPSETVNEPEEG